MIKEDYISYETAKLLNEKGFVVPYDSMRGLYINGEFLRRNPGQPYFHNMGDEIIDVCSLQLARKWLREKHHLHIEIRLTNHSISSMVNVIKYYWVMCDTETGRWCDESTVYNVRTFDTPEEAEEDAIKHALKKLTQLDTGKEE